MQALKLIGVVIVIIGFALKKDTLATVVVAGIATGLVAGMGPMEVLSTLGSSFLSQRLATLFVLTLPAIGLCERYGLREKATDFISRLKAATSGRVISFYLVLRSLASAASLRVNGHPQFVRPLVAPMAIAAAEARTGKLDKGTEDDIKALSAAADNYGNFFAQNCFMGAAGTLLIVTTMGELGYPVDALHVAICNIPVALLGIVVAGAFSLRFDGCLHRRAAGKGEKQ